MRLCRAQQVVDEAVIAVAEDGLSLFGSVESEYYRALARKVRRFAARLGGTAAEADAGTFRFSDGSTLTLDGTDTYIFPPADAAVDHTGSFL